MKHFMILTSLLALLSCKGNAQKLKVTAIYTEPKRVTKVIPETGKPHPYTTREAVTERLHPRIVMLTKNAEELQFQIQGNVSSGGHSIHQVKKIRFEKGEQNGNTITLRYYTEIKKIPGKESADVQGYNYTKNEVYKIPNGIKIIKVELYEERINDPLDTKPKLIAQQTFNFFARI
ncbi:hypothetical protein PYS58_02765 [Chryseobacterium indologenes]|uniref:hypothetical protein n=1 Tax=Chryseobacterium indologenes TaxID=253 RepID=UPI0023E83468|nr:hypothetical protein [Chryseobacterium indologenes]WET50054.1 hypothetical protein PYS58_02765 [Chryseobacterium indologenes]